MAVLRKPRLPPNVRIIYPQVEFVHYSQFNMAWWMLWYDRLSLNFVEDDLPEEIALAAWLQNDKYWRVRLTVPLEDSDY